MTLPFTSTQVKEKLWFKLAVTLPTALAFVTYVAATLELLVYPLSLVKALVIVGVFVDWIVPSPKVIVPLFKDALIYILLTITVTVPSI
jgi:hypothetical protein